MSEAHRGFCGCNTAVNALYGTRVHPEWRALVSARMPTKQSIQKAGITNLNLWRPPDEDPVCVLMLCEPQPGPAAPDDT